MSVYQKLKTLLESTPSKTELKVKKALGWKVRPEDEPGLDPGSRRQKIRTRKGQHSSHPISGGRTRKLKRKLKSPIYTSSDRSYMKAKLARLEKEGKKREAMTMYKGRPSRRDI
jgi:hypothetical protein